MPAATIRLPRRALVHLDTILCDMDQEDTKPQHTRDSHVYAKGYAVVETYGLLLHVADQSDPYRVRAAVLAACDGSVDAEEALHVPDEAFAMLQAARARQEGS